jgi:hypothetical protein
MFCMCNLKLILCLGMTNESHLNGSNTCICLGMVVRKMPSLYYMTIITLVQVMKHNLPRNHLN